MRRCHGCDAEVVSLPLRGQKPPVYVTINPEPDDKGTIRVVRSMHSADEAEVTGNDGKPKRYRLHAETCPQMGLFS